MGFAERNTISHEEEGVTIREADLLTPDGFLSRFIDDVGRVGEGGKIWVQSMLKTTSQRREEPEILDKLADPLLQAAGRGAQVILGVSNGAQSSFPDLEIDKRAALPLRRHTDEKKERIRAQRQANEAVFRRLTDGGVSIARLSAPGISQRLSPIASQVHSKFALISSPDGMRSTYLMEFNLNGLDFGSENTAIRFEECGDTHPLSDVLFKYARGLYYGIDFSDYTESIDSNTTFLADRGRYGKSIISDNARKMVQSATSRISWFSQFNPAPPLLMDLRDAAKRGVRVQVALSDSCRRGVDAVLFQRMNRGGLIDARYLPDSDHRGMIHSKLLVADDSALFTSNNLHPAGVFTGTGEIGMLFQDEETVNKLVSYQKSVWEKLEQ